MIKIAHASPGHFVWYELLTSNPNDAIGFYEHVIGWTTRPMGGGGGYTLFVNEGAPLGGTTELPEQAKQMGAPPHWISNVQVSDVDSTVEKAQQLGGRVLVEPSEYPGVGRAHDRTRWRSNCANGRPAGRHVRHARELDI